MASQKCLEIDMANQEVSYNISKNISTKYPSN